MKLFQFVYGSNLSGWILCQKVVTCYSTSSTYHTNIQSRKVKTKNPNSMIFYAGSQYAIKKIQITLGWGLGGLGF